MTIISSELEIETEIEPELESSVQTTSQITVEQLLYIGLALLAAVIRLTSLGRLPLSPQEAQEALAVWSYWQPAGTVFSTGAPAYFSMTSLLGQFSGYSDATMRLIPALAGISLVLLPLCFRPYIGRWGALLTTLFLAISPTLVATSRQGSGEMLALVAIMVILAAWLHYNASSQNRWLFILAAALGLGLTSAPLFYGCLATLAVAWGLEHLIGPALFSEATRPSVQEWRTAGLITLGVVVASGTLFLWNTAGLGATTALLVTWLGGFSLSDSLQSWLNPILALGRYEAAVLLLGTICAAWATWQNKPFPSFLAYWFIGGLILILLQAGQLHNVLILTLPGYLLIGAWVDDLFQAQDKLRERWTRWPLAVLLAIMALVVATNLGRFARIQQFIPDDFSNLSLALVCAIMAIVVIGLIVSWDPYAALQGIVMPLILILLVFNWGQAWRLAHLAATDPRERWVETATDDDLHLLVNLLNEFANQTKREARSASIFSSIDTPAMRWYLRDLPRVEYGTGIPIGATYDFMITTPVDDPQVGGNYVGTDFGYLRPDVDHVLNPLEALRWWFFYQSPQTILQEQAVLWVHTDLLTQE